MVINRILAFCLLTCSYFQILIAFTGAAALNASNVLLPLKIHNDFSPPSSHFLKDVLKAISVRKNWTLEEIRVSDVDVRTARVGTSQRYEFRLRFGKSDLEFKHSDEVDSWRKIKRKGGFGPSIYGVSSKTVLNTFALEGPFELLVFGDDELSLLLQLNTTHTGLKRVLVGEGITVEVKGAQEISLFHASDFGLPINRSSEVNEERRQFWPLRPSLCMPLPPVRISGSASLVAYRTRNSDAHIETTFPSKNMIQLLPEKCYTTHPYKKGACPIDSLTPRLALLEKLMRSFLGDTIHQKGLSGFLKAKITASTLVRFQLEVEREVKDNNMSRQTLAEWRTKPRAERVSFEVVARVEAGRLKPVIIKKVRPFIAAESSAWSILMSNMSFTKFPSVLVPQEALTLDVKW